MGLIHQSDIETAVVTRIVKMVKQTNAQTGETHITYTVDPLTPRDDFLVLRSDWEGSEIVRSTVVIIGPSEAVGDIMEKEFSSVL